MTVNPTTPVSGPLTANGSNRNWAFTFKITDATHMRLRITDADGISNPVTVTGGFTIDGGSINNDAGGTVVYPIAPTAAIANGRKVFLYREMPLGQPVKIGNQGGFYPATLEKAFDNIAMQVQENSEKLSRAAVTPLGSSVSTDDLIDAITALGPLSTQIITVAGISANVVAVSGNSANINTVAGISANVTTVAGIAAAITTVTGMSANIATVAGSIASVNSAASNMAAIIAAPTNAATAATQAGIATTKAGEAAASAAAALADKAIVVADKALVAGYRTDTQTYMSNAALSADAAADSATDANEIYEQILEYGDFNSRYLGDRAADPATWNAANPTNPVGSDPLISGLIYYNTVSQEFRTYSGSVWSSGAGNTADFVRLSQSGNDYTDKGQFRTNMDLYSTGEVLALPFGRTAKTTLVDADTLGMTDSAASNAWKKITWANFKAQIWAALGPLIVGGTAKATPVDADSLGYADSAASSATKKMTFANLKAFLKTYNDTLYAAISHTHTVSQISDMVADGRALVAMTYANMRTALGLVIGTNVQAFDAQLFSGIPVNSQSAAYALVAADASKMIYHPPTDATARVWTIPANGSVPFPIGTVVTFDNDFGAGAITIAITTDTLVLVGLAGSTGSRTLAPGGRATATKVTATRWRIAGVGLT